MQLYLITHAQTAPLPQRAAAEWSLSAAGAEQARQLAHHPLWQQVQRVALSTEQKSYLTAAPALAAHRLPVWRDPGFDELRRGGWVGDYRRRVAQAFADLAQPAEDWEPAAAALTRFRAGVQALCSRFARERLALVGHGLTLSLYRAHLLGQTQPTLQAWQQLSFAAVALVDPVAGRLLEDFQAVEWTQVAAALHRERG